MPNQKSSKTSARKQAANKRRVERNRELVKKTSVLQKVGLLPKGTTKLVSIPKGGRATMTAAQRTARRKAMKLASLADDFATPDGKLKPKDQRRRVQIITREQAIAARKAGYDNVVNTPDGPAILVSSNETVSKSGKVRTRIQGKYLKKKLRLTAAVLTEDEDGEIPLQAWLEAQFARLAPGEELGYIFTNNDGSVSAIHTFVDAKSMLDRLMNHYTVKIEQDKLGYIVLVPKPQLKAMQAETESLAKSRNKARSARRRAAKRAKKK